MHRVSKIKEIILYGAGKRAQNLLELIRFTDIKKVYIVDSSEEKWGSCLEGYVIQPPDFLFQKEKVCFHIAVASKEAEAEIRKTLSEKYHYSPTYEIGYEELLRYLYRNHTGIQQKVLETQVINDEESFIFDCYNGLGLGGIEAWTQDVCSGLYDKCGKKMRILSPKGEYNLNKKIKIMVDYFDEVVKGDILIEENTGRVLQYLLSKLPCTVITSQADNVLMAASIIKKYHADRIRIISVIHGSVEKIYSRYDIFRNDIDLYIGVSQDIKQDLIGRGIDEGRVVSMTCPFPCEEKIQRTYTLNHIEPIRIGYAGRLEYEQKRMDLLLKLIERLNTDKVNFIMELAGDGSLRNQMEQEVIKLGAEERVRFLGQIDRDQIPEFWRRQDICVNVSDFEGRSISIIEAMGNGAVPVVTDTSGVKEDIADGVNGYIIPRGNYEIMTEKIKYLEVNRDCISKMGKLAHEIIYPKSLMKPHIEFWENILESE